jgi:phosphatidylserine/phosphatidylglycerophosphate/cardiolipin synthase-like enzyme
LCTQANNGLLIDNPQLADLYKQQWDRLKAAHNGFPDALLNDNSQKKSIQVSGEPVTVWFTPTRNQADLADAIALIQKAEDGVLFLLFNPGPVGIGTLLDAIIDRRTSASQFYNPRLYIRGVLNQDLDPTSHPVAIYRDGRLVNLESDDVYPAAITKRLKFWVPELKKLDPSWAMVHSKVIILDPFGKHPVVMMGSHNMGVAASSRNDENLLIIENDRDLAEAYAVNIIAVYNQYRWRSGSAAGTVGGAPPPATSEATPAIAAAPPPATVKDLTLTDDDLWQDSYYNARKERAKEIRFWLGK